MFRECNTYLKAFLLWFSMMRIMLRWSGIGVLCYFIYLMCVPVGVSSLPCEGPLGLERRSLMMS